MNCCMTKPVVNSFIIFKIAIYVLYTNCFMCIPIEPGKLYFDLPKLEPSDGTLFSDNLISIYLYW